MATLTDRQGILLNAVALGSSFASDLIDVRHQSRICFIITTAQVGGALNHAGTITFRTRNYESEAGVALAIPQVAVVAGALVSVVVEIVDLAAGFIEFYFTDSAGGASDDTVTVTYHVKD